MRLRDQHEWADSVAEWGWSHNFDAREGIHHKETIDMNTASQPAVVVDTDQLVDAVIAQFSRNIEAGEFERDVEPALDALKKDLRAAIAAIEATPAPVKAEPIKPLGADELQEFCSGHSFEQDDYTVDVIRTVENRMQGFAEFVPADPDQRAAVKFYTDNPSAALFDLDKRRAAAQAEGAGAVARLTDAELMAIPFACSALQAIAERERLEGDLRVPVNDIRTASRLASAAYRRLLPVYQKLLDSPPTDTSAARPEPEPELRRVIHGWHDRVVALGADGVDDVIRAAEIAKRRGELRTVDGFVADWKFPAAQPASTPDAPGLTIPDDCPHMIVFDDADRKPMVFAGHGARASALKTYEQASASWNAHLFVCIDHNSRDEQHSVAKVATPTQPVEKDADALDAARYRWLRKEQQVTLITSYFGNGCVNKRIEQVEEIIDAAILAARTSEGDKP